MPAVPPIAKLGSPFCSGGAPAAVGAVGAVGLGDAEPGDDDVGDQLDVVDGVQGAVNGVESIRERAEGERRGGSVGDEEQQSSGRHASDHAGSRIYVERAIFDEFVDRFVDLADRLVVGDPTDPATDTGPLANEEHWQKVCRYFEIAEAEGAKLLTGGLHEGWWVRPTVLVNTTQEMQISHEEIFGPIVTIAPFDGEADAIRLANDSRYGLNAMVFTENARRAHRVARAVRAGTVWVNCYFVRDLRAPFGGFKDSGIGREGGKHSREFFTEAKTVVMEI
jgi:delta 1-pyrroline-5-carboxylate dehydrogenase